MSGVLKALGLVFSRESYVQDVWVSVYRVMAAFVASAVLAVPIGLLAGHTERGARLVEPFPPETIDHVELGISELGENWVLHS